MATVDAAAVKKLREMTSAGIMDCKGALAEANGDFDKAVTILREKKLVEAGTRVGRVAADGLIGVYVHQGSKEAALVELNCETDFVAKTDDFQELARQIAMQVVAMKPRYLKREEIPAEMLEAERRIYAQQAAQEGKPEAIQEKIAEGRLNKEFFQAVCLMEQKFIRDDKKTIEQLVKEAIGKLGENIQVKRFTRFKVGESSAV